jgi:intracellular sulfur oxidation DsrE/DsrF family protein
MKTANAWYLAATLLLATQVAAATWPPMKSPVIPQADGFALIPTASVPVEKSRTYRAIFDATRAADAPNQLVPALNMAGSELNALGVSGVPLANAKFVVVFHGAAMAGLMNDATYKAKFGVSNPNLPVLARMKQAGVSLFVCGQNLAFDHVDPKTLSPDVSVASDALIVLMTYQNQGYALLSF